MEQALPHRIVTENLAELIIKFPAYRAPLETCARQIDSAFGWRRALVISAIQNGRHEARLISTFTKIPRPSVYKILQQLCEEQLLEKRHRDPEQGRGGDKKTLLFYLRRE